MSMVPRNPEADGPCTRSVGLQALDGRRRCGAGLESLVVSLGQLALDVSQLAEIDLNAVLVTPTEFVLAADKAKLAPPTPSHAGISRRLRDAVQRVPSAS